MVGPVLELLGSLKCRVTFPLPQVEPEELPFAVRELEECKGKEFTEMRSDFVGLSDADLLETPPEDLPKFRDLFDPPPRGRFETSHTTVNITRLAPSIVENMFSTPDEFSAVVVYPSSKAKEDYDSVSGESVSPALSAGEEKFPVLAVSPGYQSLPDQMLLMLHHFASFGIVVISQKSTAGLVTSNDPRLIKAWAEDVGLCLDYLKQESEDEDSFLYGRIDISRAAVAGRKLVPCT